MNVRAALSKHFCTVLALGILLFAGAADAAPTCEITKLQTGPPLTVEFTITSVITPITSVKAIESLNAAVTIQTVSINLARVTAVRQNQNTDFRVVIEAKDSSGATTRCQYEDIVNAPPTCSLTTQDPGPPFTIEFTVQDTDDGLESITIVSSVNADVTIPSFSPGEAGPVIVTVERIDPNAAFSVEIRAADTLGQTKTCAFSQGGLEDNTPPTCNVTSIIPGPPSEVEFTVQDVQSGLKEIIVVSENNVDVNVPNFTQGTTAPVPVTATQIESALEFNFALECVDMQDNVTNCNYPEFAARSRPEFDAVGDDSDLFFKDRQIERIISTGVNAENRRINEYSDFPAESFLASPPGMAVDPCYASSGATYMSVYSPARLEATFEWEFTLQMKPSSDLVLNLNTCALKAGELDMWTYASQTGTFRTPWAPQNVIFNPSANPSISVKALPGPMAAIGFPDEGFFMDTRKQPDLDLAPLYDKPVTLLAFVQQGIVVVLPRQGNSNSLGQTLYELNPGDRIRVVIGVPRNNSTALYFGSQNVYIRYNGTIGSDYTSLD
jgi:hypothetical protein